MSGWQRTAAGARRMAIACRSMEQKKEAARRRPLYHTGAWLEAEPQRHHRAAGLNLRAGDDVEIRVGLRQIGRRAGPGAIVGQAGVRVPGIEVVEGVERLDPKLQRFRLRQPEVLG